MRYTEDETINLESQLNHLEKFIENQNFTLYDLVVNHLPRFSFNDNYLHPSYTDEEKNRFIKLNDGQKEFDTNIKEKEKRKKDVEKELKTVKKPKLIGKKDYQNKIDNLNNELSNLQSELNEMNNRHVEITNELEKEKERYKEIEAEDKDIYERYNHDKKIFEKKKAELLENLLLENLSSYFADLKLEDALPCLKEFFNIYPYQYIIPIIGWNSYFISAIVDKVTLLDEEWEDSNINIIRDGQPLSIENIFVELLYDYISNVPEANTSFECLRQVIIRRTLCKHISDGLKTSMLFYNFLDNNYDKDKLSAIASNVEKDNSEWYYNLSKIYKLITKGCDLALKNNDEESYNSLIAEQNQFDKGIGYIRFYFNNKLL